LIISLEYKNINKSYITYYINSLKGDLKA